MQRYAIDLAWSGMQALPGKNWMPLLLLIATMALTACSGDEIERLNPVQTAFATTTAPAKGNPDQARPQSRVFFAAYKDRKGVIQADLESAGAVFDEVTYDTLVIHVRSVEKAQLVALAKAELAASRQVVLDSNGSGAEMAVVSAVAKAISGGGPKTEGAYILQIQEGVFAVTPLESEATHERRQSSSGKHISAGNTARYALGVDLPHPIIVE
jgi:hypothetical protein